MSLNQSVGGLSRSVSPAESTLLWPSCSHHTPELLMCFLCWGITKLKHVVSSCFAENGYKPGSCYRSPQTKVPPGALCVRVLETVTCAPVMLLESSNSLDRCLWFSLSNLFHGMDKNTPVRYTVYCSLLKVASSCGAIQYIPTELDQVTNAVLRVTYGLCVNGVVSC